MRFIHTADLHLAAPFGGLVDAPNQLQKIVQQATFKAFQQIVDLALNRSVDLLIIAGDVFDGPQPSAQAVGFLVEQLQRLNQKDIPVVLNYGNHDYQDLKQSAIKYPANVRVLDNQVETVQIITKNQTTVAVTGFSYRQRWQSKNVAAEYPARGQADYQIGVLHGAVGQSGDHYAPFNLQTLNAKNYDYWALGHIHQRQTLQTQPPVVYAGNPQGLSIKETGLKGCYIIDTQQQSLEPEFIPLHGPQWQTLTITTIPGLNDSDQIVHLTEQIRHASQSDDWQLIQLKVDLIDFSPSLLALFNSGQLLVTLQQSVQGHRVWPIALIATTAAQTQKFPQFDETAWKNAAQTVFDIQNITDTAGQLLNDATIRASLGAIQPSDWQQAAVRYLQANYSPSKAGDHNAD